ncbi:MAG: S8 family serine peptidase [Deltaproteobacteria bacterium]|nr:S8 family serine peptidase [Deltaproteobacteria bacterium]
MSLSLEDVHFITAHIPSGSVGQGAALEGRILNAGLRIVREHPDGYMVAVAGSLDSLAARGFRARLLRDRNLLRLASVTLDLSQSLPGPAPDLIVPPSLVSTWPHWIIQLEGPLTASWLDAIRAAGASQLHPIPPYGLWAILPADSVPVVRSLGFVAWCERMQPAWRLHPSVGGASGERLLRVQVLPVEAVDEVLGLVRESRDADAAKPSIVGPGLIQATVDLSRLPRLAQHPDVYMIEAAGPGAPLDERSAVIVAGRLDAAPPPDTQPAVGYRDLLTSYSLDGGGVLIGFVDSGIDTNHDPTLHPALKGRGVFFEDLTSGSFATDVSGHGTHVAGAAVGNPAVADTDADGFLYGLGVAPGASFGGLNPINRMNPNPPDDLDRVRRLGARSVTIANNSWGQADEDGSMAFNQGYTSRSRTYDRAVRDALDDDTGVPLTIVAALGNNAHTEEATGTVAAPWEAKNVISVGATVSGRLGTNPHSPDIRSLAFKSSVGPAKDGRLLPTVVAPGMYITSTRSMSASSTLVSVFPGDYVIARGTSLAAPHVSGLCALYVQWWRERTGGVDPSPAMLKALLISGAVDCAGGVAGPPTHSTIEPIPNRYQGWGRASLPTVVVQSPGSDRGPRLFVDQGVAFVATNQTFTMRISVVNGGRPLRVTLVYTDAPGSSSAARALINKLSLEVGREDGSAPWHGNLFSSGWTTSGAAVDEVNNVECVYLQAAEGTYVVTVVATAVTHNARLSSDTSPWQDFALVVENAQQVAAEPVQVVLTLDTSGSMVTSGFDQRTRQVAQQFIDLVRPGDRIGLVDFNSDAAVRYPAEDATTLALVDGQAILDAAKSRVTALGFGGYTDTARAIALGGGLFEAGDPNRALVLLSDGEDHKGCRRSDATRSWGVDAVEALDGDVRVYTCALGPLSNGANLAEMAESSGGRFFSAPTVDDLGVVFGFIRGAITHDGVIASESSFASSSRVGAFVEEAATRACFTCAWDDLSLRFAPDSPSSPADISVRLRHPSGRLVHPDASFVRRVVARGHVVFDVADPAPGRWYVEVTTALHARSRYTAAGFVSSPLVVDVRTPSARLVPGAPLDILVRARLEGSAVEALSARATVSSPRSSVSAVRRRHARELDALRAALPAGEADADPSAAALLELDRRHGGELLRRRSSALAFRPHLDGLRARVVTGAAGSYSVRVLVRGRAGGRPFERWALISAVVG